MPTLPTTERTDELKVLMYLAGLLAGLAYTAGLLGWMLSGSPTFAPTAAVVAAQAPVAFTCAAWLLGAGRLLAGGPPGDASPGRWWHRTGLAATVYASIAALTSPLLAGTAWPHSAVVLGSGLVLVCAASPVGAWLLRRRLREEVPAARMPTAERQLAITSALVGVFSQLAFCVSAWVPGGAAHSAWLAFDAAQSSLFATGIAALVAGVLLRDRILADARVNPDHVRLLHAVVYRGGPLPPGEGLRDQAVRYAVAVPHLLFFQLLAFPLLFLAQALQAFAPADHGGRSMLYQFTGIALGVALVLATGYYLRQGRAGRRYALEHTVMP